MFIHNPFTIFLNTQFHIDEQNKISPLGIKSYYHSTNEPIMLTDNDLIMFIHGRIFNLQQLDANPLRYVDRRSGEDRRTRDVAEVFSETREARVVEASDEDSVVKESYDIDPYHVLLTIYKTYGIEYLLQVTQGEFVMVIIDQRVELDEAKIYAVSESIGVIPLYLYVNNPTSSNKEIKYIISTQPDLYDYESYTYPGTYAQFSLQRIVHASWTFDSRMNLHTHYAMPRITNYMRNISYDLQNVLNRQFYLSVYDRFQYDTTTRHVCCLYHELDGQSKETCTEYNILYNDLKKLCRRKNILFLDNVSTISHPETTRVFMVFGGCTTSYMRDNVSDKTNLQIDYELRDHLKTTVQTILIPLYESFYQDNGIMLEFPWMNSEWLQMYLSLPYSCRFEM